MPRKTGGTVLTYMNNSSNRNIANRCRRLINIILIYKYGDGASETTW